MLLASNTAALAQPLDWNWATQIGGSSFDRATEAANDGEGNRIVTGSFRGTCDFGDTSLTSLGFDDVFLTKYNNLGQLLWVRQGGGTGSNIANSVAVDSSENIVIAGEFTSSITFQDTMLTSSGSNDVFVAKYRPDGSLSWVKQLGSFKTEIARHIAIDDGCNILLCGMFSGTATFGDTSLTSSGAEDIFIAKLDSSGQIIWAERAGGASQDVGLGLTTDKMNNVIISGYYRSTAMFGDSVVTGSIEHEVFTAKYSSSGNFIWVETGNSGGVNLGIDVYVDDQNNILATGYFRESLTVSDTTIFAPAGVFLVKYSSDGELIWISHGSGAIRNFGNSIAVNTQGEYYVAGSFEGSIDFSGTTLLSNGQLDAFIAKYSTDGTVEWALSFGAEEFDQGFSIVIDQNDEGYVAGYFSENIQLGPFSLSSPNNSDAFFAKFTDTGIVGSQSTENIVPQQIELFQNFPNPFNPSTKISFNLSAPLSVKLDILNVRGQVVGQLFTDSLNPGKHQIIWNADALQSGVYFYRLRAGDQTKIKKMILLR